MAKMTKIGDKNKKVEKHSLAHGLEEQGTE
jgi:hypothetical protein